MISQKSQAEIDLMRQASRIVAVILDEISGRIKSGVDTLELSEWAEARILELGGKPAFKGYRGFPAALCTSINSEVVHGIPSSSRVLQEGDIVGVDVGVLYRGYYGDGACTYAVGRITPEADRLMEVCRQALHAGIDQARCGGRVNDISRAIDRCVRGAGFEIIRDLSGHGIGSNLHEDPQILNYDNGSKGARLKPGMTLAIEPMIAAGTWEVRTLADNWTVVTGDGRLSAHYEHTVLVTAGEPEILSRL